MEFGQMINCMEECMKLLSDVDQAGYLRWAGTLQSHLLIRSTTQCNEQWLTECLNSNLLGHMLMLNSGNCYHVCLCMTSCDIHLTSHTRPTIQCDYQALLNLHHDYQQALLHFSNSIALFTLVLYFTSWGITSEVCVCWWLECSSIDMPYICCCLFSLRSLDWQKTRPLPGTTSLNSVYMTSARMMHSIPAFVTVQEIRRNSCKQWWSTLVCTVVTTAFTVASSPGHIHSITCVI